MMRMKTPAPAAPALAEDGGRRVRTPASVALAHVLGARMKRLRLTRRLTLQEVGASVDLSHSFLSMLERGQADISLARAHRLASFFGVPLSELLIEDHDGARPRIIDADEGDVVERAPGMTLRLLPIGRNLGLQVAHVRFEPHTQPSTPVSHDGEDFFWVLSGQIVLIYGADEYVLKKGQSAVYSARVHHCFSNPKDKPAEMLSVTTPPYKGIASSAAETAR
jgi:mannose-6-phosphate isomerase-like protein (cupin superfamily)